ncbi:cobalt-precorrin-6A synthase [Peptococcaceae bacterium CEB3]|nr:cobalt-precorrin-6A synthase [Peptococcaceae bacterium CEB3]
MGKNKDPHTWRKGYTTGSCAAGAAKAGCLLLKGELAGRGKAASTGEPAETKREKTTVDITLPDGGRLVLPVAKQELRFSEACATIIKDAGDDPDVTDGLAIVVTTRLLAPQGIIRVEGGKGVGRVSKPGLQVPVGEAAINPVPRRMIEAAVREVFPREEVEVIIEIPGGEEAAKHTLNPRLGIEGGLSILGTTGVVRPMSEEAFKTSILPELDQAVAYGHQRIILTPGHYGFRTATEQLGVPAEAVVQMSNFVGFLLEEAAYRGVREVVLFGHIGKLIKVAGGIFHTHNRMADARMEILLAESALAGLSTTRLRELAALPTLEGAAGLLTEAGEGSILNGLARKASRRAKEYVRDQMEIGTVFTLLDGQLIGWDENAPSIFARAGWSWPGFGTEP